MAAKDFNVVVCLCIHAFLFQCVCMFLTHIHLFGIEMNSYKK
jgi:hypothetical protein